MRQTITATELARNLSDVLNRVRYKNERFVVERNGEAVAIVEPVSPIPAVTLRDVIERIGDLSMPGDGFADDLEEIQASQKPIGEPPWPS